MNGVLSHYCTCLKGYLAIVVLGRTGAAPQAPGNAFVPIGKRVCVCVCVGVCECACLCVCVCLGIREGSSLPVHMRLLL